MYSNNPDSSDFATAHANDNDSNILTNLKIWYDNAFSSDEKAVLADVIWCNDKRVDGTSTGLGSSTSYYQSATRLLSYNSTLGEYTTEDSEPTLKCGDSISDNLISKFTASTSTDGGYGNGALNGYKIGLLTTDEIAFAGGTALHPNQTYYLYKNANDSDNYWTMTPTYFTSGKANVFDSRDEGRIDTGSVEYGHAIRPTIALKSNITVTSGLGTQATPYVISVPSLDA